MPFADECAGTIWKLAFVAARGTRGELAKRAVTKRARTKREGPKEFRCMQIKLTGTGRGEAEEAV